LSAELENLDGNGLTGCPLAHARLRNHLNSANDDLFYSPNSFRPLRRQANRRHTDSSDLLADRFQEFHNFLPMGLGSPAGAAIAGFGTPRAKSSPACAEHSADTPDSTCDSACDETYTMSMLNRASPMTRHKTPGLMAGKPGRARSRLAMFVEDEENTECTGGEDLFGCGFTDRSWLRRANSGGSIPSPARTRRYQSADGITSMRTSDEMGSPVTMMSNLGYGSIIGRMESMEESEDSLTQLMCTEEHMSELRGTTTELAAEQVIPTITSPLTNTAGGNREPLRTISTMSSADMFQLNPNLGSINEDTCCTPTAAGHKILRNVEFSTPVLQRVDSPGNNGKGKPSNFLPTYIPQANCKMVHVIRHGESEYNAADKVSGPVEDPFIFDPHLTGLGRHQATSLRKQLCEMSGLEDAVWVISPLTRAIETFLLSCPFTERLRAAARGEAVQGKIPKIVICPDAREHAMTSGDVGRPASVLMEEFPELAGPLSAIPEVWWHYDAKSHPNDAMGQVLAGNEKTAVMVERVNGVRSWMEQSVDRSFVIVGHSIFLKEFLAGGNVHKRNQTTLKNCEVRTIHL